MATKKKNKNEKSCKIDGEQVYLLTVSGDRHEDHIPAMFGTADQLFKERGICLSHLKKGDMDDLKNGEWLCSYECYELHGWSDGTPWYGKKKDVANEMMKAWKEGGRDGLIKYFLKEEASSGKSEQELKDLAREIEEELFEDSWQSINIIAVRVGDITVT